MGHRDEEIIEVGDRFRARCRCGYSTSAYKRRSDAVDAIRVHQERRRLIEREAKR
jgi:hypothetical protein